MLTFKFWFRKDICLVGEGVLLIGTFKKSTGEKLLLWILGESFILSSSIIYSVTIILKKEGEGSSTSLPFEELAAYFVKSGIAVDFHD